MDPVGNFTSANKEQDVSPITDKKLFLGKFFKILDSSSNNNSKIDNKFYLRIANIISNNQNTIEVDELKSLNNLLDKEISVLKKETSGIRGFFLYLFDSKTKVEKDQRREYLSALKDISTNVLLNKLKEDKQIHLDKKNSDYQSKIEIENPEKVAINKEIERLDKAIVWVLKGKLDGLKSTCLNFNEQIIASARGNLLSLESQGDLYEEGIQTECKAFIKKAEDYQEKLRSIPYYSKNEVAGVDIHTYQEIVAKSKEIFVSTQSIVKQAKDLLSKLPKESQERKNLVNILKGFSEDINKKQSIFKAKSSDVYILGMQTENNLLKQKLAEIIS